MTRTVDFKSTPPEPLALQARVVYFAALTASRFNPPLAEDYNRLIAKGKEAKVAITALMRKLVVLANTLITEDRPWQPIQP